MAVDMVGASRFRMEEHTAIEEAASAGLKSMEHLIRVLSSQTHSSSSSYNSSSSTHNNLNCSEITDITVSKFKQVINLLNRTGHARFRRAPKPQPEPQPQTKGLTLDFAKPNPINSKPNKNDETLTISTTTSSSSFMSSITADASVSDGKIGPFLAPPVCAGKPPLSSSHRKRCHDATLSGKVPSSGHCHCSKRRKLRVKRTVRVPAISSKIADIPSDEYSWRKYGQKPIKGSPYPRYYSIPSSITVLLNQ